MKPRLFIISSRFPFPLEKGDKLRLFHQIKGLSNTFSIDLFALTETEVSEKDLDQLKPFCAHIHVFKLSRLTRIWHVLISFIQQKPLQTGFFFSYRAKRKINQWIETHPPDYLYCQLVRVSEYVKAFHSIPKTIDYMDVLSIGMERTGDKSSFPLRSVYRYEAKRLKMYERLVFDYFDQRTIISRQDQQLIHHPDKANIHIVANGISEDFFDFPKQTDHELVFVGNLSYAPNMEAVRFISSDLLTGKKNYRCLVSGASPSAVVRKLCDQNKFITLQGWVEDIRESYARGRIFIAPMMTGTGMQNKLLEAMALGIPCITTSLANNAIQAEHGKSIFVADDKTAFLEAIERLLNDHILYKEIAEAGKLFVRNKYSWLESNSKLTKIILNKQDLV